MTRGDRNGKGGGDDDLDALLVRAEDGLRAADVTVDGKPPAARPDRRSLREAIIPLLLWCRGRRPMAARGLVGIAGPPGAGKSTLMAWVAAAARVLEFHEFAFIGLDGYHLPNAVLDARKGPGPDGDPVSMRLLKGIPESFDGRKLLDDLRRLRATRSDDAAPAYSRVLHEPAPGGIRIPAHAEWVFVEGNFLFLDTPPWRDIRDLLERKVYLDIAEAAARKRLAARHAAAGRDEAWIEAHYRRTDGPNVRRVRETARFADIVIRW